MLLQDKTVYLVSAFSLNMLLQEPQDLVVCPLNHKQAREIAQTAQSAIRHEGMARILSDRLGLPVPVNYTGIKLGDDSRLLVGWYSGPQISHDTHHMSAEGRLTWWLISRR